MSSDGLEMPRTEITRLVVDRKFVDEYGHINYLGFPELFEAGQDAHMAGLGFPFREIQEKFGLRSFVKAMSVTYRGQLFPEDVVHIKTEISDIGNSSFTFRQIAEIEEEFIEDHQLAAEFELVVVLCGADGKKASIPDELRKRLSL